MSDDKRPTQRFTKEYLRSVSGTSAQDVVEYLESFRLLQEAVPTKTKLISMKVEEDLLALFRKKCEQQGLKYQTQIKKLMRLWV